MICLTAIRRPLIALSATLLSCIMMTAAKGQMPPISGGNVRIVQNAKKNAATDISFITDSRVNQFEMTSESNRGDYFIYSSVEQGNGVQAGIYMTAVRQNGRDNSVAPNAGGNTAGPVSGKAYATCGLEFSNNIISIPVFHAQTGAEFNVNVAALFFPYRTVTGGPGWIGGWARNAFDNGPITVADSFFSPGINPGTQFLDNGGGSFTLNLAGVPGAPAVASQHGVLLTTGGKNEDNYSLSRANADGTFSLFVRDNGVATGLERDPIAFAYIPAESTGVVAGRVRGNGTQTRGAGSGTFTTTTAGVAAGQVLLTVPGVAGPNDAVLIVTAEGGGRRNAGNIVSYEWNSARSGYVVESRHLTDDNSNVPDLESVGPEPMFSFALVRTKPQISVEEPAATRRANGSAVKFGDAPRGSPVTKTFTIRNNRAGSLHLSSVTKDGPAAADYTLDTTGMAASLANGETTTFSVTFAPGGDGSRIARVLIHSSSSEHPVYYLLLSSRGIPTPVPKTTEAAADGIAGTLATDAGNLDLIAYEPFDYPPDKQPLESQLCIGGQGWQTRAWQCTVPKDVRYVVPQGLVYPGLQTTGGSALHDLADFAAHNRFSKDDKKGFVQHRRYFLVPAPETAVRYLSFLYRQDAPAQNLYYGGLEIAGDAGNGCLFGSSYTHNGAFRLESGLGKGIKPLDGLPEIDRTYFVVIKCETGPGNDRFSLFLDPDPGGSEPAVPLIVKSDTEVGRLNKIHLSSYLPHAIDEIRFGKTWASVTPGILTPTSDVVPSLAENFMIRGDGPDTPLSGHCGGSGPWVGAWSPMSKFDTLTLQLSRRAGGAVIASPGSRMLLRSLRSFVPALPDRGEAWLSFSMLASGSGAAPWADPADAYGGISFCREGKGAIMVGLDSGIWSGRDVSRGKEFWIVKRHPANPIKPSVPGGPTPPVSDVEMSKFSTTIRRTVVVKLDLAPDEGGGASVWLHPLGVGLVDVNRPPDCILPCLDLTGIDTIRIIGTAFLEVGPLRMGPTAAHVDTLARKTEVFQFDAGDEFSGDPGCVYGRSTGHGWTAPWGWTPANQSTPAPFQMTVSPEGGLQAETPTLSVGLNGPRVEGVQLDTDEKQTVAGSATTFRSLPAVFPDKGTVLLTFDALLDGDLDHLTVGLMAGSCLAASITRDRRADDKNWVLLDPVYRLRPWLDAGNKGASGRIATGTGPAGWHTVAVRLNLGPENTGTTSLWTREGRGPLDTAAPPRGTLTGCRFRGVDALMLTVGGTAQLDNISIKTTAP